MQLTQNKILSLSFINPNIKWYMYTLFIYNLGFWSAIELLNFSVRINTQVA